jgi:hypothetical protein
MVHVECFQAILLATLQTKIQEQFGKTNLWQPTW